MNSVKTLDEKYSEKLKLWFEEMFTRYAQADSFYAVDSRALYEGKYTDIRISCSWMEDGVSGRVWLVITDVVLKQEAEAKAKKSSAK